MHFLVLLLQWVLNLIAPSWRDSLTLAARADGRIEHLPHRFDLWLRWWKGDGTRAPARNRSRLGVDARSARPAARCAADAATFQRP